MSTPCVSRLNIKKYKEIFYGTKSYQDRLLHDLIDTGIILFSVIPSHCIPAFLSHKFVVFIHFVLFAVGNTTKEISIHAFTLSEGELCSPINFTIHISIVTSIEDTSWGKYGEKKYVCSQ